MPDESRNPSGDLRRDVAPPPELKTDVQRTLRARGIIRRGAGPWRIGALAAAAVLVFLLGNWTGRRTAAPPAVDERSNFALLLYEGPEFDRPAQDHSYLAEYAAWAEALRKRGQLVEGHPLSVAAHVLSGTVDVRVESRDVLADAGVLGGFFIIRAADESEAVAIARTCPHLRHGGTIALRPVIPT